jgi:hypothetical protein
MAVADQWIGGVRVFLNNQVGVFQEGVEYATGEEPVWVVSADLNGDSYPDLAVSNKGSATLSVLLNQGNGSFQSPVEYTAGYLPRWMSGADLDADSDIDLIVGYHQIGSVEEWEGVWLNNGDGTFISKVDYSYPSKYGRDAGIEVADVDGDSYPDLVVHCPKGVHVFLNKGSD